MAAPLFALLTAAALFENCFAYVPNLLYPEDKALISLAQYDPAVRPPGINHPDHPVNVSINFFLRSIEKVDQSRNEYKIQITFREEWVDPRLAFTGDRMVATNDVQLFWKPDVFFSNERVANYHTVTKPNVFARIHPNGHILLSSRISLTLYCPMVLWAFPFDTQECTLRMASYGYTTDDVLFEWKSGERQVQYAIDTPIPGYRLANVSTSTCNSQTSTGEYACLQASFTFFRNSYPYIIRIYIPLLLLVVASWTSFWMPEAAVTLRLVIGSITSLTTAFLIFREEEFLRLPSLTALDVWVGISAFFVFAALFEYALLTYNAAKEKKEVADLTPDVETTEIILKKSKKILWMEVPADVPVTDAVSRIVFPASYLFVHVAFGPILF